jgi:RNA polymerase sigma-70 factor (ECF subfamily)
MKEQIMEGTNNYGAIVEFITKNRNSSYRLAYSYVHNKEDALDILQDSICKALTSVKKLEKPEAVRTWFYRIIVNSSIDFIRKNKRYVYLEDDALEAVGPSSEDQYENLDLRDAINRLPTLNKTVIVLRFFEGLKIEDIANILNENINTTKSRLYKSLKKLRLELEEPLLNQ